MANGKARQMWKGRVARIVPQVRKSSRIETSRFSTFAGEGLQSGEGALHG